MSVDNRIFEEVMAQDNMPSESRGWIQWKGTDVCMDIHCQCGAFGHVDQDFLYQLTCSNCGRTYAVGQSIKLIELNPEQKAFYAATMPEAVIVEMKKEAR